AVLPDKIEGTPGSVGWRTWRSRHRGWSHWPLLYLALLGALTHSAGYFFYDAAFFSVLNWLLIGALLHIAEDAVCGKVPLLTPSEKYGIRLFTVGSFREYLFVLACIAAVYVIRSLL
ncbi:metal-dependent hydrolase, partial [Selenomonas sp. F0473]|uniref:metal-dependent hydrolase n=1 Tax=Selenomonas sp. F0473 TaxID=999423 RepID=UPI0025FA074B